MLRREENRMWVRLVSFIIAVSMIFSSARDVFALRQASTNSKKADSNNLPPIGGGSQLVAESKFYKFGTGIKISELNTDKFVTGGKGANLGEMTAVGLPVPPGFTIPTAYCRQYNADDKRLPEQFDQMVGDFLAWLEETRGKKLGDTDDPLLVSVRSGAPFSMPGMMDTILNLGLNDKSVIGLANNSLTPDNKPDFRFAWDSYRRFVQMFSKVVFDIDGQIFEDLIKEVVKSGGHKDDTELTAEESEHLVRRFQEVARNEIRRNFPQDPREQLDLAIRAVFDSWNGKRAVDYRNFAKIDHNLGTAVNVQMMVYGNRGDDSGTGVAFSRDPATGEKVPYGDFLINAQGEDVVAGIRKTRPIQELADEPKMQQAHTALMRNLDILEKHFRDVVDTEFTIENGEFFMLQTRVGKRTAGAAIKIAVDMVNEGLITDKEAVLRVEPDQLEQILTPQFDKKALTSTKQIAEGLNASPGAAVGQVVFSADDAEAQAADGEAVILARWETTPDDLHGMIAAQGILTSHGGKTSHAAVVARGMGKPAVCGADALDIDKTKKQLKVGDIVVKEGDWVSIDGTTGKVFLGKLPLAKSEIEGEAAQNYKTLLGWADKYRKLGVRANADTPEDALKARNFGAEGIGLARTEHMFMGARLELVQKIILNLERKKDDAAAKAEAERLLKEELLPMQKNDFIGIYKAMAGYPVTIRLLDPPLHEFLLPAYNELVGYIADKKIELAKLQATYDARRKLKPGLIEKGPTGIQDTIKNISQEITEKEDLLKRIDKLREANPMLGLRGVRLGLEHPEIYKMQARAIIEAAIELKAEGYEIKPEIMIPLVGKPEELQIVKKYVQETAEAAMKEKGVKIEYSVGTMIELPAAALAADQIAQDAEFFSFGTNDLTQTTFGFSRDDIEAKIMPLYMALGIFKVSPFETIDYAVAELVRIAVEKGKKTNPDLKIGICGEHGGDPDSIDIFNNIPGLDYVSASPYRIPIAILAAAQAAILDEQSQKKDTEQVEAAVDTDVSGNLKSAIIAAALNISEPAEVTAVLNAGNTIHTAEAGAAFYDYVADVRESLKKEDVKGRALILGPEFFRRGGVTEALRTVDELNKAVKIVIYGEDAQKLKSLMGNPNIIIASYTDISGALNELENKHGISPRDAVLLLSPDEAIREDFIKFWKTRQIVAPEGMPATLVLAKALHELLRDTIMGKGFETLLNRIAEAEIIDKQTLNENRDELLGMLQEGQTFAFKTELVTERMSKDVEIADARKKVKKFMSKYI